MSYLTTGPVDEDQFGGDVALWQASVFNNTDTVVTVTLRVLRVAPDINEQVGQDIQQLEPGENFNLIAGTNGFDRTIAIVEHPLRRDDILVTVYGLNSNNDALPGATYRHTELIEIPSGVRAFYTNVTGVQ